MSPIQLILILSLGAIFLVYFLRFRSAFRDRLLALAFGALGLSAVIFPNVTTSLAHLVGVGRGADLVFYFFIVLGIFSATTFYSRLMAIEDTQTKIVRGISLQKTEKLD